MDSEVQAQKRCGYLLNALSQGFEEEDMKFMKDRTGEDVLEDIAVIFGMNGRHTPELAQVLKKLETYRHNFRYCKIKYSIITYTWGSGGTIAQSATEPPYQDIREHLKNYAATKTLVRELRGNDQSGLVYFSFIDSDTIWFNFIYSEYLQIVREQLKKDSIPPTVMSTGYEFHRGSDFHIASWIDRMVRVAIAEVNPLFVYYPELNFCVLVHDKLDTIEEHFIKKERKNKQTYKMESPVLISQLKTRANFKAVFSDRNPTIIVVPSRFSLHHKGLITGQSAMDGMNLAKGACCNGELINYETFSKDEEYESKKKKGIAGINRGFIMQLFKCQNEKEFEELSKKNPYRMEGNDATMLVKAVKEAREYKEFIYDLKKSLMTINVAHLLLAALILTRK